MGIRRVGSWSKFALLLLAGAGVLLRAPTAHAGQDCTTGPFVEGVDTSYGQGVIDWSSAKSADSIDFAFMKATQGTGYTDSDFATNWAAAKADGVVRGAYHFLDPTVSGVDQANHYLSVVGTIGAGDLPPMLDIECPASGSPDCLGNGSSGAASATQILQVMNDWISTIETATGRTPIVYTYGSYFTDNGVDTTGFEKYPLYIADPTTGCFDFPAPWTAPTFWQYSFTGTVSGISGQVDRDRFLGTAAEFTAFLGGSIVTPVDGGTVDSGPVDVVPDAGGTTCTIGNGDEGECLDTTVCTALGGTYEPTPGFCPGAANIQCCTGMPGETTHDAGTGAGSGSGSSPGGSGSGSSPGSGTGSGTGNGTSSGDAGSKPFGDAGTVGTASADGGVDGSNHGILETSSSGGCSTGAVGRSRPSRQTLLGLLAVGLVVAARRRRTDATSRAS